MVSVPPEGLGNDPVELCFDLLGSLSRGKPGSIADPEDMGIDRKGLLPEGSVENHVGGFPANSGECLQLVSCPRDLAAIVIDERPAERDHVLRLGVEQADGLDRLAQPLFSKIDHLPGRPDPPEQWPCRNVDAGVGRLSRQHDCNEQRVGVDIVEFSCWRRIGFSEPPEEFQDLLALHLKSSSARPRRFNPASKSSESRPNPTRKCSGISNQRPGTTDAS